MKHKYFDPALVIQRAFSELKAESRRGSLGILWWVVEPLLYVSVFYVVFTMIFKRGGEDSVASLLTALVVWKWFDNAVRQSSSSITSNIGLLRQVYISKLMLPSMAILTSTLKFLLVFCILIIFLLITGHELSLPWLSIPFLFLVQISTIGALSYILAAIVPYQPDLRMLIDNGMTLLFFMSGIFFDIKSVPENISTYLKFNPMLGIIDGYRSVLLKGVWPDMVLLFIIFAGSILGLFVGVFLLKRFDKEYLKII